MQTRPDQIFRFEVAACRQACTVTVQACLHCYRAGMRNNLMYLSMMIRIYISVSAIAVPTCPCHFVVKFWLSGSFRVRVGVKTSLVTDSENEIATYTVIRVP